MTLAVVGGVAGASALLPTPPSLVGQEASEPAGTSFTLGPVVADPSSGSQDWTVRTYPSKTDWTCAEVGRTDGKAFGRLGSDDEIVVLELPELGSCADLAKEKFALWVNYSPASNAAHEPRVAIFGAVSSDVVGVALTLDGSRKELPVTRGAFLDVLSDPSLAGAVVTVSFADGSTDDTTLRAIPQHNPTPPTTG
ncbi:MAG: hypothetical protein ABW167_09590 [Baekduia sp.]